jgi:hypothetical protein
MNEMIEDAAPLLLLPSCTLACFCVYASDCVHVCEV